MMRRTALGRPSASETHGAGTHGGENSPADNRTQGTPLLLRQLFALSRKNLLTRWRNRQAALLQALQAVLFVVLIWVIQEAIFFSNSQFSALRDVPQPRAEPITSAPLCTGNKFIKQNVPCLTLIYTPLGQPAVEQLVEAVRLRNKPVIPADQVRGFDSTQQVDAYLQQHPSTTLAAVHFKVINNQTLRFVVQTNTSVQYFKGQYQHHTTYIQLPLQQAVEREAVRLFAADEGIRWDVAIAEFPHPKIEMQTYVGRIAPVFVLASLMFNFVSLLTTVVGEKERGVRSAMAAMGLRSAALWGSWLMQEVMMAAVHAALMCGVGRGLGLDMFTANDFSLVFMLVYTSGLALSSMALVASTLMHRSAAAAPLGFALYIVAWVFQMVIYFGFPYRPSFSLGWQVLFSLLPWSLLSKGVMDLSDATVGKPHGISWARRTSYCTSSTPSPDQLATAYYQDHCVLPLGTILWILVIQAVGWSISAAYLDAVFPGEEERTPLKPCFCLVPPEGWRRWWGGKGPNASRHILKALQSASQSDKAHADADVAAEAERVRALAEQYVGHYSSASPRGLSRPSLDASPDAEAGGAAPTAVPSPTTASASSGATSSQGKLRAAEGDGTSPTDGIAAQTGGGTAFGDGIYLFGLRKVFERRTGAWWRLRRPLREHVAVAGTWLHVPPGQCFCLLGPNGAGKTTTIKMLTGLLEPSAGDALVCGESLRAPLGVQRAQANTGVCPQFDVLWDELTAQEHMALFGAIKGLPAAELPAEAARLLDQVRLGDVAAVHAGTFSGGMRRRLSVALALLGDPAVLILDEPTTGMDPVSRRYVWDLIAGAKKERCVVLTTHSMEEADALGDAIAVMARGQLRCLGSGLHLKAKLGSGYRLVVRIACKAPDGQLDQMTSASQAERLRATAQIILGEEPGEGGEAQEDCTRSVTTADGVTVHVVVPRAREQLLPALFLYLEDNGGELGVADVAVGLPPLEQVFLKVVEDAERQWASQQGLMEDVFIQDEEQTVAVPVGANDVVAPSGRRYLIQWEQDPADGCLKLRDYQAATP